MSIKGLKVGSVIETVNGPITVLENRPLQGYLTISNALQWRLQYKRAIDEAGKVDGIVRIR